VVIAGNHEQEAAAGSSVCGCGYSNPDDEKYSCLAHQYAMDSLSDAHRQWMGALPDLGLLRSACGTLLLCHGSPDQTNEFLYESELSEPRLRRWLDEFKVAGMICTHTGLPWIKPLSAGRFAANCGVVGKPDHDGDPAVHYALLKNNARENSLEIRRVEYDYQSWCAQLASEGVDPIFIEPLHTGLWTTGAASLPERERFSSYTFSKGSCR
jgi:diadenosine tetraphosphatase ApaH/serine/threonine PP2A family protein phosphatase